MPLIDKFTSEPSPTSLHRNGVGMSPDQAAHDDSIFEQYFGYRPPSTKLSPMVKLPMSPSLGGLKGHSHHQ